MQKTYYITYRITWDEAYTLRMWKKKDKAKILLNAEEVCLLDQNEQDKLFHIPK